MKVVHAIVRQPPASVIDESRHSIAVDLLNLVFSPALEGVPSGMLQAL